MDVPGPAATKSLQIFLEARLAPAPASCTAWVEDEFAIGPGGELTFLFGPEQHPITPAEFGACRAFVEEVCTW